MIVTEEGISLFIVPKIWVNDDGSLGESKHLGLWMMKHKPLPRANAPPIDVFPEYVDQSGPCADDYIRDPQ